MAGMPVPPGGLVEQGTPGLTTNTAPIGTTGLPTGGSAPIGTTGAVASLGTTGTAVPVGATGVGGLASGSNQASSIDIFSLLDRFNHDEAYIVLEAIHV